MTRRYPNHATCHVASRASVFMSVVRSLCVLSCLVLAACTSHEYTRLVPWSPMTAEEAADMRARGESEADIAQTFTFREADARRVLKGVRTEDPLIALCGHRISFARVLGEHRATVIAAWCRWVDEGLLCTDANSTEDAVFDENPQRAITRGEGVSNAVALEIVRAYREQRIVGLPAWGGIPFTHEHVRRVERDGPNYKVTVALEDCESGCGGSFSVSLDRSDASGPLRVVASGGAFCE